MNHRTSSRFWHFYQGLPTEIRALADKNFDLLKRDPSHPSLHFKRVGRYWSVRVGIQYRAIAVQEGSDVAWFWIGPHDQYEVLIRRP